MLDTFFPILVLIALVGGTAGILLVLSLVFGRRTRSAVKEEPYESGMVPVGDTRERFSVKFYLVAILFIIFDIEVIFLYPWAVIYNELALFGLVEMAVFIAILVVGYVYVLRTGALKWD
jgi:NADH-quinone oxidoreductase subunit A